MSAESKPTFKAKATIGELYKPAMELQDSVEAEIYFEALVEHNMTHGNSRVAAEQIERINLGYFAGYYDNETRQRVERLFRCLHPVFGSASNAPVSPEQAFEAGKKLAENF